MLDLLWSSELSLGIPSMDASHRTLFDKLAQLQTVPDADFPIHYAAMVARMESDFREEEELMERIDFPGMSGHREQHAKLLGELHQATAAIMAGDVALGRHTMALLTKWLVFHISTMDTALSFAVQFRSEAVQDEPAGSGLN